MARTPNAHPDSPASLPKAELHVHLEGAIPLPCLWQLMEKYGGDPEVKKPDDLPGRFRYRDFPHFIDTWVWKNRFLREYDDFTLIAESIARDFARQSICYVEAFYSAPDFERIGLELQPLTQAIRRGLSRVPEVDVLLIADLVRDFGPERAARTLRKAAEVRDQGVIGIGIGGSEQDFPAEPFAPVYEEARKIGFHTTAHAGEAAGAASVRAAVEVLRAERIGHGTRAFEDPALLDLLAEKGIPLEMCPISNLRTGAVARIEDHPIRLYFQKGIRVTVNTDDPAMFNTSLAEEYEALETRLGFTEPELRTLVDTGFECSWEPAIARESRLRAQARSSRG
jgi:adenosine deaminase